MTETTKAAVRVETSSATVDHTQNDTDDTQNDYNVTDEVIYKVTLKQIYRLLLGRGGK